jgi:hypothetical protein
MSTKDTPEEVNDEVDVKPVAKKTVRKTIRRVRKVASKHAKEEHPESDAAAKTESPSEGGEEQAEARGDAPKKRPPRSNQRGSRGSSESEDGGDPSKPEGRERKGSERRSGRQRRTSSGTTPRRVAEPVNQKSLSKKAWKIFQADIAEEGIALVDDKTGRNLALRSFELARMFLEEEGRHRRSVAAAKEEARKNPASASRPRGDLDEAESDESSSD